MRINGAEPKCILRIPVSCLFCFWLYYKYFNVISLCLMPCSCYHSVTTFTCSEKNFATGQEHSSSRGRVKKLLECEFRFVGPQDERVQFKYVYVCYKQATIQLLCSICYVLKRAYFLYFLGNCNQSRLSKIILHTWKTFRVFPLHCFTACLCANMCNTTTHST